MNAIISSNVTTNVTLRRMTLALLAICLLPTILNLVGVDFGAREPSLNIEAMAKALPSHGLASIHHGLYIHSILEWSAFCTAVFTIMLTYVVIQIKRDLMTAIVAMAMFWVACMDAFHTLAADRLIEATADIANFIPFTWAICRTFYAVILMSGVTLALIWPRGDGKRINKRAMVTIVSLAFGALVYGIIYTCASSEHLPQTTYVDALVTRPWDAIALALFCINAILLWLLYQRIGGVLIAALLASTIPNVATQAHMVFGSTALFDNHFNIAHFL